MSSASEELELYNLQLAQVTQALASDPNNAELQTLKHELENLIQLTQSLAGADSTSTPVPTSSTPPFAQTAVASSSQARVASASGSTSGPSTPTIATATTTGTTTATAKGRKHGHAPIRAGDEVQARYSADGKMYPARVVAVSGDPANPVYTVVYKGYGNTEMLTSDAVLPSSSSSSSKSTPALNESSRSQSTSAPTLTAVGTGSGIGPVPPATSSSSSFSDARFSSLPRGSESGFGTHGTSFAGTPTPPPPPPEDSHPATHAHTSPGGQRPDLTAREEKARKKLKNEKKLLRREEKQAISIEKAATWQKFAAKATKKGSLRDPNKSIFRTSENPYARVGVSDSGSGTGSGIPHGSRPGQSSMSGNLLRKGTASGSSTTPNSGGWDKPIG
ncbi:hypothetical protein BCV70DRAFT_203355 [Testicularia cyperi]|uniref:Tudor domain-containing protein n=1 Tax=Testicularia cyperi TaxID=1882483 RepID=A0A317XHD7_9BASI|nr:hypothetical protein BCV70DRAFT_203355 [Testicularia cyperi]